MKVSNLIRFAFSKHSRYLVVGGGTGGVSITSHLLRSGISSKEITIIDPSPNHYYQPGWTMVGAGQWLIHSTSQTMEETLPKNVPLSKETIKVIKPEENKVVCESGAQFTYDDLILATGMRLQFEKIPGLKEALDDPNSGVASIYQLNYAEKMAKIAATLKQGKAIFTEPAMPIKCAGAPQKILYLWSDKWSQDKLPISVEFVKTIGVMFGVPKYAQALTRVASSYNINTTFKHPLVKIENNEATFQNVDSKEQVVKKFDLLHVVPPMGAHAYIGDSGLGDATGFLDCDKGTLRHKKFSNIWGIGDCTNLPNAKTAAAIFTQTETLHDNLLTVRKNPIATDLPSKYEGYASCPLFVGKRKLILAEFKYDGVIDQTFLNDQEKPRYIFYLMKRFVFPLAYWWFVPRGLWAGRKGIRFS